VAWKDVLAKTASDLGPNALTNPDGSATPQLEELGRVYERIAPHAGLIRRWRPLREGALEAAGSGRIQAFARPKTPGVFAVLVNDDLRSAQAIPVRVGKAAASLTDLLRNRQVPLAPAAAGGGLRGEIRLEAGDGTILRLKDR
jgi:hypothetical protein